MTDDNNQNDTTTAEDAPAAPPAPDLDASPAPEAQAIETSPAPEAPAVEAPAPEAPAPEAPAPAFEAPAPSPSHDTVPEADGQLVAKYTDGGHELDPHSIKGLFTFLIVLGVLVVISGIGTMQLFRDQTDQSKAESANRPKAALDARRAADKAALEGYHAVDAAKGVYGVPVEKAMEMVIKHPVRLKAGPAPAGWLHPDDVQQ